MLDPRDLYTLADEQPEEGALERPVLLHALGGFIDAGNAGRLAGEHLLSSLEHKVLAEFDVDQLYDYRARRPPMTFMENHWESYEAPRLILEEVKDVEGRGFLMLTGPEPDIQWERFVAAVTQLVDHYDVRLTVGVHAIPMAVPHTRPSGMTAHATRKNLIDIKNVWAGNVQVPGNVAGLLELRLGQAGKDAAGFAVHVPHYLTQAEFPDAAVALVDAVADVADLTLPTGSLIEAGIETRAAIEEQVSGQPEVAAVVSALEQQYDAYVAGEGNALPLADGPGELPTADELGAELERFLAEENERKGRGDS
ncbi:PAC2 family protein [Kineosporia succinea]|uniref:ATP-grasp superfamily ATP-dependent carboligase n=1 Tax=Kineosporia succinea TaxID=84632 RepID=A0ABT9NVX3_9ACTN|nr:PAC2 family protein [Kineosporia succinea]MDP9824568.1 putative ATP-grasp superfamily ATP-dependent carboligase [Kineosporia succinea]